MKKKKLINYLFLFVPIIILIILSLLVCTSIVLICSKNSDNTTLDEVRLKDIDYLICIK